MNSPIRILELGGCSWRLFVRRAAGDAQLAGGEFPPNELAAQADPIGAALVADGYQGEPIVVSLESLTCLAATVPIERPQDLRDRQTMLYRLEEWIPWGAEDFAADFLAAGDSALAVAVTHQPLGEFIHRLAEQGIYVQGILPTALLAALAHANRSEMSGCRVLAVQRNGWIDLVRFDAATPTAWTCLPARGAAVRRELESIAIEVGVAIDCVGYELETDVIRALGESPSIQLAADTRISVIELALTAADQLAAGRIDTPLELQPGPIGRRRGHVALRRYWLAVQLVAAVLVAAATFALTYRGHAAGRLAERVAAQQADVFRVVFPNAKVPVGVTTRLKSELAKLQGLRGDDGTLADRVSAIAVLERLLKAAPTDRRFRLLEIRIEEGRLYLDGETRVHSDAEAIAQRLRAEGFEVSSPKTQRLDDQRVSLRITATLSPADRLAMRKSP